MKNRLRSKSTASEVTCQINTTPTLKNIPPVPINYYFFGFLGCVIFLLSSCSEYNAYVENKRRENFDKHFEAFQKLEHMQREDIKILSGMTFERVVGPVGTKVSEVRLKEYRRLMKLAGIERFIYISSEPKKRMVEYNENSELIDSGYVYMENPPSVYFKSFSECKPIMPSDSCYVLLRENWYMYNYRYRLEQDNAK